MRKSNRQRKRDKERREEKKLFAYVGAMNRAMAESGYSMHYATYIMQQHVIITLSRFNTCENLKTKEKKILWIKKIIEDACSRGLENLYLNLELEEEEEMEDED